MKESVRRILIFVIIVGAGTLLIFNDLPLLLILPLIIAIGFVLLILLGAIPLSELKGMFRKKTAGKPAAAEPAKKPEVPSSPKATASPKRRFSIGLPSFFKKKGTGREAAAAGSPPQKTIPATGTTERRFPLNIRSWFRKKPSEAPAAVPGGGRIPAAAPAEKKKGFSSHVSSLVSSFKAFGTILTTKKKADPDQLKKIDTLLDLAVHDTADSPSVPPAQAPAGKTVPAGHAAAGGGTGAAGAEIPDDGDPFFSLSNDELDAGLLDGLDDDDDTGATPVTLPEGESPIITITIPDDDAGVAAAGVDAPLPPELASAADDILKANEADSADLPALEGLESVDENLGDLDNLSLDSLDLGDDDDDEDTGLNPSSSSAPAAPEPAAVPAPAPSPAASPAPSGRKGSDQSEMAAFAAASGGDDDMLSSLASDIKSVKKEQDLSLLRELKDFRAPGTTIETELTDLYTTLNAAAEKQKKIRAKAGPPKTPVK